MAHQHITRLPALTQQFYRSCRIESDEATGEKI